jgi:hypothetical protein
LGKGLPNDAAGFCNSGAGISRDQKSPHVCGGPHDLRRVHDTPVGSDMGTELLILKFDDRNIEILLILLRIIGGAVAERLELARLGNRYGKLFQRHLL